MYNGNFGKSGTDLSSTGTQVSTTRIDRDKQLHNVRADYRAPFGLSVGAEYTHYSKPSNQLLKSTFEGADWHFRTEDRQTIDRWKVFAGQEHSLGSGWELNYGVDLEWARDKSFQWYYDPATGQKIHVAGDGGFSSLLDEQSQNGGFPLTRVTRTTGPCRAPRPIPTPIPRLWAILRCARRRSIRRRCPTS